MSAPGLFRAMLGGLTVAAAGMIFPALRGQEVIASDYRWHYEPDGNATLPAWRKFPTIKYPASFLKNPEIRYVIVLQHTGVRAQWDIQAVFGSGGSAARDELMKASASLRLKTAAMRDGQPAEAEVWFSVIFNPPAKTPGDVPVRLLQVGPAPIPYVRDQDHLPRATVRAVITPEGRIEIVAIEGAALTPDQRRAAEDCVARWKFSPAQQDGRAVFGEIVQPVAFLPMEPADQRDRFPPRLIKSIGPALPFSLWPARPHGEVLVHFFVEETGAVSGASVIRSSDHRLDQPVLTAVRQWKYQPATAHGKPVRTGITLPVRLGGGPAATPGLVDGDEADNAPAFDVAPRLRRPLRPLYPPDLAAKGATGRARVAITVGRDGRVKESHLERATELEFGRALQAALNAAEFTPATKGPEAKPVEATLHVNREFDLAAAPGGAVVTLAETDREKLAALEDPAATGAARLKTIAVDAAGVPALRQTLVNGGWAELQVWLEWDGSVHLPRPRSYSQEMTGYAAIQCLADRRLEPPAEPGWRKLRVEFSAPPPK